MQKEEEEVMEEEYDEEELVFRSHAIHEKQPTK